MKLLIYFSFFLLLPLLSFAQTLHIVEVTDFEFIPENVNISVGDTVEWQWIEGFHTTTSDSTSGQNVWDAPIDPANPTYRFVITAPGIHNYVCTPHLSLGMVGTITAAPVSSVNEQGNLPEKYTLSQNYPNPFNPNTTISYSIPTSEFVVMKVFNAKGQEVKTLVNEQQPSGQYEVQFNESNLASGIYFYRIKAGSFIDTKKMILLR